jgi:SAM-dependent methyltransferase
VIDTALLWLVPGLQHPVYRQTSEFFRTLFRGFEALDYRAAYLAHGPRALERELAAKVDGTRPGVVMYSQFPNTYAYLTPQFLRSLGRHSHIVGLGYDDEIFFDQAKFFYQSCDAVITTDIAGYEWLRQAGVPAYIAQLAQPDTASAAGTAEDIDVSFIGDMSKPGRREYISHLQASGIDVKVFGAGSAGGRITDEQVRDVFRRSKVNLNFTRTNAPAWIRKFDPLRSRFGQIKGRPFELAAMEKFCLCEWAPCVQHWFRPGVDLAVFRDADELLREVRRALGDDGLRRRMAASAREHYLSRWLPVPQFTHIFGEILAAPHRGAARQAEIDAPIYHESMGRSRGVAALHALRAGQGLRALCEMTRRAPLRLSYWAGLAGGMRDTLAARLRGQ